MLVGLSESPAQVFARLELRSTTDPETGCKIWNGARLKGYGVVRINKQMYRTHRLAWEAVNGPVPDGLELDHLCHTKARCDRGHDCPHRPCWNPEHLEPITHAANILRGDSPWAKNARKTHCIRGHEFVEHLTVRTARGGRSCFLCRAQRNSDRSQQKAAAKTLASRKDQ